MIRQRDRDLAETLRKRLIAYRSACALPGIEKRRSLATFVGQLIESRRRVVFVRSLQLRPLSRARIQPNSGLFDPIRAACVHKLDGNIDEASWLCFLATHFGKHRIDGWRLAEDVYGALDDGKSWTFERTAGDPDAFRKWLALNLYTLRNGSVKRRFGNHRKYESLHPYSAHGTGAVVASYIGWVTQWGNHSEVFDTATRESGGDPTVAFHTLYHSMSSVGRFGRTGRFDYLCLLGNLGLVNIVPGEPYLRNATGPLRGARLLFDGSTTSTSPAAVLEGRCVDLNNCLDVGMQVLEDALCNWQKSPYRFKSFRG